MNWIELSWAKDREGCSYIENVILPKDTLLICKFIGNDLISFFEMVYADTGEGFYALQTVDCKYWDSHNQRWELEHEWDDDYFPVAYTLYPNLLND